jgi:hypothetical protein
MSLERALDMYADHFKDNFPIMAVRHMDEDEMIKMIEKAIKENKPYEADYDDEGVY